MSVSNLISSDINSIDIPCTLSGAMTGGTSVNFKRFDNIVYLSFNFVNIPVSPGGLTITITPDIPIPLQFKPTLFGVARPISLTNNSLPDEGRLTVFANLSLMQIVRVSGGAFSGSVSIVDNCVIWRTYST